MTDGNSGFKISTRPLIVWNGRAPDQPGYFTYFR